MDVDKEGSNSYYLVWFKFIYFNYNFEIQIQI